MINPSINPFIKPIILPTMVTEYKGKRLVSTPKKVNPCPNNTPITVSTSVRTPSTIPPAIPIRFAFNILNPL